MAKLNNWFADVEQMVQEADTLLSDVYPDINRDEALVTSFYNGADTMDAATAEYRGVHNVTNHLFGYDSINGATSQIEALYNREPRFWKVELRNFDDALADHWGNKMTEHLGHVIRESRRFKNVWRSASGDMVLHGRAALAYLDRFDWCPEYVRMFVPSRTGTRPEEVPYAFVPRTLSMLDIERFLKASEHANSPWNRAALLDAKECILENVGDKHEDNNPVHYGKDYDHVDDVLESQEGGDSSYRTGIPVWYVFSSRPDEEGVPFDLTIINRKATRNVSGPFGKTTPKKIDRKLYHQDRYHKKACKFLHPFFMEAKKGGDVTWHRVTGLGHLNYNSDVEMEEFFNEAMQGSRELLQRMWRVDNSVDMDRLNQWVSGEGASNVIPEGVDLVEQAKNANFPFAFTVLEQLRQVGQQHAQGAISNTNNRSTNELEVQALERQGRNAQVLGNRLSDIYETADALGVEVVDRFLMPVPKKGTPGREEIEYFQRLCEEDGIPLAALREKVGGRFKYLRVRANRGLGDGDRVREIMALRVLTSPGVIDRFSPAAQQVLLRKFSEAELGNSDLAEELVPRPEEPPSDAEEAAGRQVVDENYVMDQTGQPLPLRPDENSLLHFQGHLAAMAADVQRGQMDGGWRPSDLAGFMAKAAHVEATFAALPEGIRPQAQQAAQQVAQAAQPLVQSARAATPGTPENLDMQLKQQKAQLEMQKQESVEFERDRRFALDTKKAAVTAETQMALASEQERKGLAQQAGQLVDTVANAARFDFEQEQARRDAARPTPV